MQRHLGTVLLLVLLSAGLFPRQAGAQHYIGIRGGTGGGMARFEQRREMRLLWGYHPSVGISWKYYGKQLGVGSLQADLQYLTKGYRELRDKDTSITDRDVFRTEYRRTMETIELPLFWQLHLYALRRRVRLYLNLGVYASYMFRSQEYTGPIGSDPVWQDYPIVSVRDNPFGYGLAGGVGFGFLFGRFEAFAEGRYAFGFSDVLKNTAKYPPNTRLSRSPVDLVNVSVGLYYRLGRGGIQAPLPGANRFPESWDSIPVGRNREQPSPPSPAATPPQTP